MRGPGGALVRALVRTAVAPAGVLVEAWGEVRVHRARVVLSLVGVLLAVFAMTVVTAAGAMGSQALLESSERSGGRSATLALAATRSEGTTTAVDARRLYAGLAERFGITWWTTVAQTSGPALSDPARPPLSPDLASDPSAGEWLGYSAAAWVVDPDWAVIHRVVPASGRFLVAGDAQRLVPAVVLNGPATAALGTSGQEPPYAAALPDGTTVLVVGTVAEQEYAPAVWSLPDGPSWLPPEATAQATPSLEVWVPPERSEELAAALGEAVRAQGWVGEAYPTGDPSLASVLSAVRWGVRAVSLMALGLGALSVLNVGVVTVRQRVREIGVRRALGASSARVFWAIVLESVVATAVAGALGVALAVALVTNLPLDLLAREAGISEVPPFPVSAAVEALVAATAVGALAGLVPATIAVRARVVDALRY